MKTVVALLEHPQLWAWKAKRPMLALGKYKLPFQSRIVEPLPRALNVTLGRIDKFSGGEVMDGPSWLEQRQLDGTEWWKTVPVPEAVEAWKPR